LSAYIKYSLFPLPDNFKGYFGFSSVVGCLFLFCFVLMLVFLCVFVCLLCFRSALKVARKIKWKLDIRAAISANFCIFVAFFGSVV